MTRAPTRSPTSTAALAGSRTASVIRPSSSLRADSVSV
jgi:hypothetical protein